MSLVASIVLSDTQGVNKGVPERFMTDQTTRAMGRGGRVIEVRGLSKIYGQGEARVEALAGASFVLDGGEWASIMGPSGSGKSTLMNLLGLLDRPSSGSYALDGREVSALRAKELARVRRQRIGFVFQGYNLLSKRSALENVELPMIYADVGTKERRRRATEALETVGLGQRYSHKPPELSGGQQQRVAIARALVNEPTLVLADEPTGNLDSSSGDSILQLFTELHNSDVTLMVVTHDGEVAARGARTIEIRDGLIVSDTDSADTQLHSNDQPAQREDAG